MRLVASAHACAHAHRALLVWRLVTTVGAASRRRPGRLASCWWVVKEDFLSMQIAAAGAGGGGACALLACACACPMRSAPHACAPLSRPRRRLRSCLFVQSRSARRKPRCCGVEVSVTVRSRHFDWRDEGWHGTAQGLPTGGDATRHASQSCMLCALWQRGSAPCAALSGPPGLCRPSALANSVTHLCRNTGCGGASAGNCWGFS
jgi:hypothetical protein